MTKPEVTLLKPEKNGEDKDSHAKKKEKNTVPFVEMFRFADTQDKFYIFLGTICSMINGVSLPVGSFVFGEMVETFMNSIMLDEFLDSIPQLLRSVNLTRQDVLMDPSIFKGTCKIMDKLINTTNPCDIIVFEEPLSEAIEKYVYFYISVGVAVFIASMGQHTFWTVSSERQANRIRREFLTNVLRQDIGWFDTHNAGELNAKLSADIVLIQKGLGDNTGSLAQFMTLFFSGYLLGFIRGWQLAFVLVSFSPIMLFFGALFNYLGVNIAFKELIAYSRAGAIAEEILGSIRTVVAFGGEEKARARYDSNLGDAHRCGIQKGAVLGGMIAFYGIMNFSMYSLGMWYGGKLVRDDTLGVNDILMVFFSVSLGTISLGIAVPNIQAITEGKGAAYNIFQIIDMESKIDSSAIEGLRPRYINGKIQFRDIHFSYPARRDAKVLNGASIDVPPGQTIAIVGTSGCGKSTLLKLLLRFYDPQRGRILVDGIDIKQLNIKYLRRLIGIVSQEPILFATSIAENIRYGLEGVTTEEITQAAKDANAYDFISELPDAFNTIVGERGAQLSGGQKQRIAIARALVRDPKILLLDEATSALDNESEAIVQDALDKARQGRTTIVIAHRLSTIRTADIIIGLDQGTVKESGTHEQLMTKKGIYYTLVTKQITAEKENESSEEDIAKENEEKRTGRKRLCSISNMDPDEQEIDEDLPEASFSKLLLMNTPEWPFLLLGCLCAVFHGSSQPAFAYIFGKILKVFSEEDDEMEDDLQKYCIILFLIGVVTFFAAFSQTFMFGFAGEALTERLRSQTFKAMLYQEIGWFDKPYNSTGALTSRLSKDASLVQGATGTKLGVLVQCFVAIAAAIIMALIFGWQLTLVTISFLPLMVTGGIIQTRLIGGKIGLAKEASENAAKVAVEILENVSTVASLSKEREFLDRYMYNFEKVTKDSHKRSVIFGVFLALSNASPQFSLSVIFAYGGYLVDHDDMAPEDVLNVFTYIVFSGIYLGQAAGFTPDIGKATAAARRLFYVLQRKREINAECTLGEKPDQDTFHSTIEFSNTTFSYPRRPEVPVLQRLNLTVNPGQTVALVGSSGCGKSTCVSLLERFYDIDGGSVSIGGTDLVDLNIRWLRSQIGLVLQEPVLFDCSIAENIAYGDNERQVSMEEIIKAAQKANIHNFVTALSQGYDTNVGDKGTLLSGGQKQRIAIARALVRDPKILLLDEATSSLDTESETIVQEALDKARKGRTCICIAHRLSTIRDADKIVVLRHGTSIEEGTHEKLMAMKGVYYGLQNAQSKG